MTRKQPANSITAAVKAMSNAAKPIQIPDFVRLDEKEAALWPIVVRGRARDEWSDADLTVAADLCKCMVDMEAQGEALKLEGYVLTSDRGAPMQNPRNQVIEVLTRRKLALMKMLQMQPRAIHGNTVRLQETRKAERVAEMSVPVQTDQFLAAPMFQ